ncbi:MAG: hypothetical protein GC164_05210 [Phycisphaera sp.]|nr:hypothetical protein [Phycisphaera sp.]
MQYLDGTIGGSNGPVVTSVGTVVIGTNFTGSSRPQSGFIPPDTMGAVGPNHIVEIINGRVAYYQKDGTFLSGRSLNTFFSNAGAPHSGSFAFDPRIVYDPSSSRWFAAAVDNAGGANNYLLAVSSSSDPTSAWTGYKIDTDADNSDWADFPMLGINGDRLVLSANMFAISAGSSNTGFVAIDKAGLIAGTPTITKFEDVNPNNTGFGAQPIVDLDYNSGSLKTLSSFNSTNLKISSFTGTAVAPTLSTGSGFISVTSRSSPPDIDQPGTKNDIDAGDTRFSGNVVQQHITGDTNPTLWGTRGVDIGGRAAIEWFQIDAVTNAVLQTGTIDDISMEYNYPSISVNDDGDVVIGFSGGDPNTFISTYAVVGKTTAGITSFSDPILLKAGIDDYQVLDSGGRNRWGDYSSTVLDPADPSGKTFWTFQEFVSADNQWSIQITEIQIPEPMSFALLAMGGLVLSLRRLR